MTWELCNIWIYSILLSEWKVFLNTSDDDPGASYSTEFNDGLDIARTKVIDHWREQAMFKFVIRLIALM